MNPNAITVLLLTYNEAANIDRTLRGLSWARTIVVVDSFSTDDTCERISHFSGVHIFQRAFDNFANQCNYGLAQVKTEWVLSLDADYGVPPELVDELQQLETESIVAFQVQFRYCVWGHPLRASLYPPRPVLFRKERCKYVEDGHAHRLEFDGEIGSLKTLVDHDDRKPIERWLSEQFRYSVLEARKLTENPWHQLTWADRVRRTVVLGPIVVFFFTLFGKGLILDGWPGWHYTLQRSIAEVLLSLRLIELKISSASPRTSQESKSSPETIQILK